MNEDAGPEPAAGDSADARPDPDVGEWDELRRSLEETRSMIEPARELDEPPSDGLLRSRRERAASRRGSSQHLGIARLGSR